MIINNWAYFFMEARQNTTEYLQVKMKKKMVPFIHHSEKLSSKKGDIDILTPSLEQTPYYRDKSQNKENKLSIRIDSGAREEGLGA